MPLGRSHLGGPAVNGEAGVDRNVLHPMPEGSRPSACRDRLGQAEAAWARRDMGR